MGMGCLPLVLMASTRDEKNAKSKRRRKKRMRKKVEINGGGLISLSLCCHGKIRLKHSRWLTVGCGPSFNDKNNSEHSVTVILRSYEFNWMFGCFDIMTEISLWLLRCPHYGIMFADFKMKTDYFILFKRRRTDCGYIMSG